MQKKKKSFKAEWSEEEEEEEQIASVSPTILSYGKLNLFMACVTAPWKGLE